MWVSRTPTSPASPRVEAGAAARRRADVEEPGLRSRRASNQIVEDFRTRPLDGAPYAHVTLDALVVKCRKGGRTVDFCVGVNKDGFRESRGLDVVISEDGAVWLAYMPAWSPAYGIRARRTYADPRVTHDDRLNPL